MKGMNLCILYKQEYPWQGAGEEKEEGSEAEREKEKPGVGLNIRVDARQLRTNTLMFTLSRDYTHR